MSRVVPEVEAVVDSKFDTNPDRFFWSNLLLGMWLAVKFSSFPFFLKTVFQCGYIKSVLSIVPFFYNSF